MSTKQTRNRFAQRRNANNRPRPDKRPVKQSSEQVLKIENLKSKKPGFDFFRLFLISSNSSIFGA